MKMSIIRGIAAAMFLTLTAFAQEGEDPNPLQLAVTHAGPAEYQPGQVIEITVNISASSDGSVTALGLLGSAPDTWTFAGVRGITGDLPAVSPQPGSAGRIEFAWINMPQFPYSFAYTLQVPPDAAGQAVVQGQVEYRTNAGRQVTTPDFITIQGPENLAPKIELIGSPAVSVQEGNTYQDAGVTATDPEDGDLTSKVQVTGSVDTSIPGVYELSYDVRDKNGQAAPTMIRTVTVTPKPVDDNNDDDGGNDNGGVDTPTTPRNNARNRGLAGGPGFNGGRMRDENLANTGVNGTENVAAENLAQAAPQQGMTDRAAQAQRASELAQNLAQNAPVPGGVVTPGAMPPLPGPRTANMARGATNNNAANTATARPASPEEEDLQALDDALGIETNTGEATADAATAGGTSDDNDKLASVAAGVDPTPPTVQPVPGLLERVSLRINGLGRRELMTILAAGVVLLGLVAFATVAGRIAYAGPTRRKQADNTATAK